MRRKVADGLSIALVIGAMATERAIVLALVITLLCGVYIGRRV